MEALPQMTYPKSSPKSDSIPFVNNLIVINIPKTSASAKRNASRSWFHARLRSP
jgi:hypothetical protein